MTKKKKSPEGRSRAAAEEAMVRAASMTEEELKYCEAFEERFAVLTSKQNANAKIGGELAMQNVGLNPVSMVETYIRILAAHLFPTDSVERLDIEIEYQEQIHAGLENARSEMKLAQARSKLVLPGQG